MEVLAKIELDYNFAIRELSHPKVPHQIYRNNILYHFEVDVLEDCTKLTLGKLLKGVLAKESQNQVDNIAFELFAVLNQFLAQVRTFYHGQLDFFSLSPLTVKNLNIQLIQNDHVLYEKAVSLKKQMPRSLSEYYDILNDNPYEDWWDVISEEDQLNYITLIMDSWYLFTEGKYNESIINCCTAIESYIFPILIEYFKDLTLSKSVKVAKEVVMDISMHSRVEILFGTVEYEYLGHLPNLLRGIKQLVSVRNSIIHRGRVGTRKEAWDGLENTSKLFLASFNKVEDLED